MIASPREDEKLPAFRRIFQDELRYVFGSLRRLGVSERDAEDLAHEVFLKVYGKLETYDTSRPIRPWLFGFAFRAASDYRRLARHRVEVMGEETERAAPDVRADDAMVRAEEAELVSRALESIDLDRRAVLIAYEIDEQPMKEIAEALGIPLFTGYSRLRTAREELADEIRRRRLKRGEA